MNHKFLFILSPPFSGSTLITRLIGTSKNTSIFKAPQSEGQKLDDLKDIMMVDSRWNEQTKFPWETIKEKFLQNWNLKKSILVEKSPPNIIRTKDIIQYFQPVFFIITIRNPYAWANGVYRRGKSKNYSEITLQWIKMAKYQMENITTLENSMFFKYEDLTDSPEKISLKIGNFLTELKDIKYDKNFELGSLQGRKSRPILNLNNLAISKINLDNLHEINKILRREEKILDFFSYEILSDEEYDDICKKLE